MARAIHIPAAARFGLGRIRTWLRPLPLPMSIKFSGPPAEGPDSRYSLIIGKYPGLILTVGVMEEDLSKRHIKRSLHRVSGKVRIKVPEGGVRSAPTNWDEAAVRRRFPYLPPEAKISLIWANEARFEFYASVIPSMSRKERQAAYAILRRWLEVDSAASPDDAYDDEAEQELLRQLARWLRLPTSTSFAKIAEKLGWHLPPDEVD